MLMAYRVSGGVKCPGSRASLGALRPSASNYICWWFGVRVLMNYIHPNPILTTKARPIISLEFGS